MADSNDITPTGDTPKESATEKTEKSLEDNANVEEAVEASELGEPAEGGWWGSWITAAKSKSVEVLGMVKKDLDELSTVVKSEASHVINTTSSAIGKTFKLDEPESTASAMKKSFSSFLDQVNTVLNPSPDDDDTEAILIIDGDSVTLTNFQRDLLALQKLDATYLIAPDGPALASMAAWLEATTRPSPATLEKHLRSSPVLQEKIERLVPHAVGHDDFWERYLFRKALLEDKLAQTNRITNDICSDAVINSIGVTTTDEKTTPTPVDSPSHSSVSSGDSARSNYGSSKSHSLDFDPSLSKDLEKIGEYIDGVVWDSEDFASTIDLTEEQQTKLLEEYENEISANEKNKQLFEDSKNSASSTPDSRSPKSSPLKKALQKNAKETKTKTPISGTRSKSSDAIVKSAQENLNARKLNKKPAKKSGNDVSSNMIEDHFIADNKNITKKSKIKNLSEELNEKVDNKISDSASNNSDESWEKEFEIDDMPISAK